MAFIKKTLSRVEQNGKSEVLLRVFVSHKVRPRLKSGIYVDCRFFQNGEVNPNNRRYRFTDVERREARIAYAQLSDLGNQIFDIISTADSKEDITREYIYERISWTTISPELASSKSFSVPDADSDSVSLQDKCIYDFFDDYVAKKQNTESRGELFVTLKRQMMRYEMFERMMGNSKFGFTLDNINFDTLDRFQRYLAHEGDIAQSHPKQYEVIIERVEDVMPHKINYNRTPSNLSRFEIIRKMKDLRAVCKWLLKRGYFKNDPFAGIQITERHYTSRPVFITIEERKDLAALDLSNDSKLATQRDIFVFQCLVGCRYSDLIKLTDANIMTGDILQYKPSKTKKDVNPVIPRVPLCTEARNLIEKYKGVDDAGRLFPFTHMNDYNLCLKRIFTLAGLTRKVYVMNPHSNEPEQAALNEIVSSHMARRTFVGNLYNKIKDPGIISVMSGHTPGSKSFFRYRDIGDDIRQEIMDKM